MKRIDDERVVGSVDRRGLVRAQTPQGARRDLLVGRARAACRRRRRRSTRPSCSPATGSPVATVAGDPANVKITHPADLELGAASPAADAPGEGRAGLGQPSVRSRRRPAARRRRASTPHRACTGTPTATSSSTRSAMRCSARPASATSDGSSRPARPRRPASTARSSSATSSTRVAARCPGADAGRCHDPRRSAPPRSGSPRRDARADRGPRRPRPGSRRREGRHGQPLRRRRRRSRHQRRLPRPAGRRVTLRFRNTLGGAVETFEPLEPGHVRMYSCGPTVYAPAHVGNFRSFVFADLVRRALVFAGYRVTWVMNITDVDDKIIRDAAAAGITIERADRGPHPDVPRGPRHARHPAARRHAAGDRAHRRHGAAHRDAHRARPRLHDRRRLGVLPHRLVAGLRPPRAPRPGAAAARRARRRRRVRQGRRPRLRALEGRQARRAELVDARRRRAAGLAHRVLGDEHALPGRVVRHPHRRRRPDLPAPRGRDRPVGGRDGRPVRADVAPLRAPPDGRPEDGQARRQPRAAVRPVRARVCRRRPCATRSSRRTTARRSSSATRASPRPPARSSGSRPCSSHSATYRSEQDDDPRCRERCESARAAFGEALADDLNISAALGALFDLVRDLNARLAERSALDPPMPALPRPRSSTSTGCWASSRRPRRRCLTRSRRSSRSASPRARRATGPARMRCGCSSPTLGVLVEDTRGWPTLAARGKRGGRRAIGMTDPEDGDERRPPRPGRGGGRGDSERGGGPRRSEAAASPRSSGRPPSGRPPSGRPPGTGRPTRAALRRPVTGRSAPDRADGPAGSGDRSDARISAPAADPARGGTTAGATAALTTGSDRTATGPARCTARPGPATRG